MLMKEQLSEDIKVLKEAFMKLKFENRMFLFQPIGVIITDWGYEFIYCENVGKIDGRLGDDRVIGSRSAMIWVSAETNPNGVTGKDDIAPTYSIRYELSAERRMYRCKYFNESVVLKFYAYDRTIDGIIVKFQEFLDGRYHVFMNDSKLNRGK